MSETPDSRQSPEEEWLARYRAGQLDALQELVEHYRRPLYSFILRMSDGREDADDVFQEVWYRVIKHIDTYQKHSFKSWLFRITRNLIIDRARKRKPIVDLHSDSETGENVFETRVPAGGISPAAEVDGRDLGQRIREAVRRLPENQREVYLLRMEADLSFKEIAGMLDISINTALGRMHYAIQKLRESLKDEYAAIGGPAQGAAS